MTLQTNTIFNTFVALRSCITGFENYKTYHPPDSDPEPHAHHFNMRKKPRGRRLLQYNQTMTGVMGVRLSQIDYVR